MLNFRLVSKRVVLVTSLSLAAIAAGVLVDLLLGGKSFDVLIVDTVLPTADYETDPNPEPTIAVDPTNPNVIAMTAAWTGIDECQKSGQSGGWSAGVLMTFDGGDTWSMRCWLPTYPTDEGHYNPPGDLALEFSGDGKALLASYMSPFSGRVVKLTDWSETSDLATATTLPAMDGAEKADQPFVVGSPQAGSTAFAVGTAEWTGAGENNCYGGVVWWWNTTGSDQVCVAKRDGSDAEAVRVAINASGHAYAGFFSPTSSYDPPWQASLVLTRGTISDGSAATFGDLKETDNASPVDCTVPDGKLGFRMRPCVYVPDDQIPPVICPSPMGKQRRGENQVAIAIDPNDATKTYIAYADSQPGDFMTLHLVAATASASSVTDTELRMVHNALNPGVAVTRSGRIGFVYQAFVADAANPRWQTRIEISNETHAQWDTLLLSDTPSDEPAFNCGANEAPYLGDYLDIGVAGNTFYGVFSADNNPAHHESPSPPGDQESVVPAKYLRDKTLLGPILTVPCSAGTCNAGGGVNYSIDPFFFRVTLRVHPWTSFKEHANATFLRVVQFFRRIRQVPPPPPPPPPLRPPSK